MNTPRVILLLGVLLLASSLSAAGVGSQAPDFRFDASWNTPSGKTKLSDYQGSVVLVEVWATW